MWEVNILVSDIFSPIGAGKGHPHTRDTSSQCPPNPRNYTNDSPNPVGKLVRQPHSQNDALCFALRSPAVVTINRGGWLLPFKSA